MQLPPKRSPPVCSFTRKSSGGPFHFPYDSHNACSRYGDRFNPRHDEAHLRHCDQVLVLPADEWKESQGVQAEIELSPTAKDPRFLRPGTRCLATQGNTSSSARTAFAVLSVPAAWALPALRSFSKSESFPKCTREQAESRVHFACAHYLTWN
jgi:hypothetical protein